MLSSTTWDYLQEETIRELISSTTYDRDSFDREYRVYEVEQVPVFQNCKYNTNYERLLSRI